MGNVTALRPIVICLAALCFACADQPLEPIRPDESTASRPFVDDLDKEGDLLIVEDRYLFTEGRSDLFAVDPDGNEHRITNRSGDDQAPDVSPDGSKIVLLRTDAAGDIDVWVQNWDGTELTNVSNNPGGFDLWPVWSPDGKKIAFHSTRNGNTDIYTVEPDGSHLERITTDPASDIAPQWAPNGKSILFSSRRSGGGDLYVVHLGRGTIEPRTFMPGLEWPGGFSPDGRLILFTARPSGVPDIYVRENELGDGSTAAVQLTHTDAWENSPTYSPDGTQIAFARSDGNDFEIFLMSADGTTERQVTFNDDIDRYPRWTIRAQTEVPTLTWDEDGTVATLTPASSEAGNASNFQSAVDLCLAAGKPCSINLAAGEYQIDHLTVYGFDGTIIGAGIEGSRRTTISPLTSGIACPAGPDRSLLRFIGGNVKLVGLQLSATESSPCSDGSALDYLVGIESSTCETTTTFSASRSAFEGDPTHALLRIENVRGCKKHGDIEILTSRFVGEAVGIFLGTLEGGDVEVDGSQFVDTSRSIAGSLLGSSLLASSNDGGNLALRVAHTNSVLVERSELDELSVSPTPGETVEGNKISIAGNGVGVLRLRGLVDGTLESNRIGEGDLRALRDWQVRGNDFTGDLTLRGELRSPFAPMMGNDISGNSIQGRLVLEGGVYDNRIMDNRGPDGEILLVGLLPATTNFPRPVTFEPSGNVIDDNGSYAPGWPLSEPKPLGFPQGQEQLRSAIDYWLAIHEAIDQRSLDGDGDGSSSEDPIDGVDNDGDGLTDEDPPDLRNEISGGKELVILTCDAACWSTGIVPKPVFDFRIFWTDADEEFEIFPDCPGGDLTCTVYWWEFEVRDLSRNSAWVGTVDYASSLDWSRLEGVLEFDPKKDNTVRIRSFFEPATLSVTVDHSEVYLESNEGNNTVDLFN